MSRIIGKRLKLRPTADETLANYKHMKDRKQRLTVEQFPEPFGAQAGQGLFDLHRATFLLATSRGSLYDDFIAGSIEEPALDTEKVGTLEAPSGPAVNVHRN